MQGPYNGCQEAPIYAFGLTLLSCNLAVLVRTITKTVIVIIIIIIYNRTHYILFVYYFFKGI